MSGNHLIVDGHHVHPAKQRGGMLLVTDAMPPVGSDQSAFALRGETITNHINV